MTAPLTKALANLPVQPEERWRRDREARDHPSAWPPGQPDPAHEDRDAGENNERCNRLRKSLARFKVHTAPTYDDVYCSTGFMAARTIALNSALAGSILLALFSLRGNIFSLASGFTITLPMPHARTGSPV